MTTASDPLDIDQIAQLRESGVTECFIPAAILDLTADQALEKVELPELPRSVSVTLVVRGESLSLRDPEVAARRTAEALQQLRFDTEARGYLPVGIHLDLLQVSSIAAYGDFLEELRSALDPTLYLSVSLPRAWLDDEGVEDLVANVDFVVAFLYGQRLAEAEAADAWDFLKVRERLGLLDQLEVPYMVGIVTLGTARHDRARGGARTRSSHRSLREFLWNRTLRLRPGFSLEGMNRRVYNLKASEDTKVGDWEIAAGDEIHVVRIATSDLEELLGFIDLDHHERHIGQLYFRLPAPDEQLSLTLGNILNGLDETPATPDLALTANPQRRIGRGWLFRFGLSNVNGELTELSLMENNFIQVKTLNGSFGTVKVGDFYRYDLFQELSDGSLAREFRGAQVLRLHIPLLDGGQWVVSGDVQILSRNVELELQGQFLLPDGRTIPTRRYTWRDGELIREGAPPSEPSGP